MDRNALKIDLEYVVQVRPLPEGQQLSSVLSRLDAIAMESGISGDLKHYLSKRSYIKALAWLENPEMSHQP